MFGVRGICHLLFGELKLIRFYVVATFKSDAQAANEITDTFQKSYLSCLLYEF